MAGPGYVSGMKQRKVAEAVPTEVLVKLSPEQIRFVPVKPDRPASTGTAKSRWPETVNLIGSIVIGFGLGILLFCLTKNHVGTPSQYLANVAGGGVLYGAIAMLLRAIHSAYPDMRLDVSAGILTAMAGLWVAIVALVEITVLGASPSCPS